MNIDELIAEANKRHPDLRMGKNDPILITVTLNELVISKYIEMTKVQLESYNRQLTTELRHNQEEASKAAKEASIQIITQATEHVAQQIKATVENTVASVVEQASEKMRKEIAAHQQYGGRDSPAPQGITTGAMLTAMIAAISVFVATAALVAALVK